MDETRSHWEEYYSMLKRMPKKLKKTARFVVDAVPDLKSQKARRVLDLGCGAGRHSVLLAGSGFEVVGIDTSKSALKMANRWVRREGLRNVAFVRATMTNIPLNSCCLDAVISVSVIHHALKKDIVEAVNEILRTLGNNGRFLANLASVKDPRYRQGRRLEKNTYWILEAYEKKRFGELHHFLTHSEVSTLLHGFARTWVTATKEKPYYWEILAIK